MGARSLKLSAAFLSFSLRLPSVYFTEVEDSAPLAPLLLDPPSFFGFQAGTSPDRTFGHAGSPCQCPTCPQSLQRAWLLLLLEGVIAFDHAPKTSQPREKALNRFTAQAFMENAKPTGKDQDASFK